MDVTKLDNLLGQMRTTAALAAGRPTAHPVREVKETPFGDMLQSAVSHVNTVQQDATNLSRKYEMGDPNVGLPDVMISMSKANVSFQGMVQVRNKLVSAYHDMMNMQV